MLSRSLQPKEGSDFLPPDHFAPNPPLARLRPETLVLYMRAVRHAIGWPHDLYDPTSDTLALEKIRMGDNASHSPVPRGNR